MTWQSVHDREDLLRTVAAVAAERLDGRLPMDVDGVARTFVDEADLLAALQLRWHTRLSGRIERELMDQPDDLEHAVVAAWQDTADELPGIRAVLDGCRTEPSDDAMARLMAKSAAKEHALLALMAGRGSAPDDAALRAGARIERRARDTHAHRPPPAPEPEPGGLLDRIKAVVAV